MNKPLVSATAASLLALASLCALPSCSSHREISSLAATVDFPTTCMDAIGGRQTMRVWGRGNNKGEALERARKHALEAVIFEGVPSGTGNCRKSPLVTTVNAREKYRTFFDKFFSSGQWKKFASLDEKRGSRKAAQSAETENWQATVEVRVTELARHLEKNGIPVAE